MHRVIARASVVPLALIALLLAVLLVKNSKTTILLRALYFFPTILSSVSVGFIWKFVYDPNFGVINSSLDAMGLGALKSSFLGDESRHAADAAALADGFRLTAFFLNRHVCEPRGLELASARDGFVQAALKALDGPKNHQPKEASA